LSRVDRGSAGSGRNPRGSSGCSARIFPSVASAVPTRSARLSRSSARPARVGSAARASRWMARRAGRCEPHNPPGHRRRRCRPLLRLGSGSGWSPIWAAHPLRPPRAPWLLVQESAYGTGRVARAERFCAWFLERARTSRTTPGRGWRCSPNLRRAGSATRSLALQQTLSSLDHSRVM
jgi:hypothetical protein